MLLLIVYTKFSNEENNRKYIILHQKSQFYIKSHQKSKLDHYNVFWSLKHLRNLKTKMVHISTTACATAKPFTPMCSPRGRDCQKNSGLSIWTTSWPYFYEVLTTWIASNKRNLKTKWCTSQQLLVLRQNRLHQCVHHVVGNIRKIMACRFEQLRDLIFMRS